MSVKNIFFALCVFSQNANLKIFRTSPQGGISFAFLKLICYNCLRRSLLTFQLRPVLFFLFKKIKVFEFVLVCRRRCPLRIFFDVSAYSRLLLKKIFRTSQRGSVFFSFLNLIFQKWRTVGDFGGVHCSLEISGEMSLCFFLKKRKDYLN